MVVPNATAPSPTPWTEAESDGALTFAFDGVDVDEKDEADFAALNRTSLAERLFTLPPGVVVGALLAVIATLTFSLSAYFKTLGLGGWASSRAAYIVLVLVILIGGTLVQQQRRARLFANVSAELDRAASDRDQFTLRVSASGVTLTKGQGAPVTWPLASVEAFAGGPRITLLRRDGQREVLPCVLRASMHHPAFALRLNEALRTVRASSGYRGEA